MDNPNPGKQTHYDLVKTYFNKDATEYERYYEGNDIDEMQRKLRKRNDWKTYTSVLDDLLLIDNKIGSAIDVGCGIGNFLFELVCKKKFKTIVGVDFLKETMRIAHEKKQFFGTVDFIQGNLLSLPFKERSFDLTVCVNVLHHVHKEDVPKALDELSRITNKYLMVEIRNRNNVLESFYENIPLRRKYKNLPQYTMSISELQHMMQRQGFAMERIKGRLPATWLCRRLVCAYKRIDER
jgi:ubiquinone/menaquinone biosynthesis C-methylase UbiE